MSSDDGRAHQGQQPRPTQSSGSRTALVIALTVLAAGAITVAIYNAKTYYYPRSRPASEATMADHDLPKDCGSPDAKLKIEVCVGACITFVAQAIADTAEPWPDKVRAEFYSYQTEAGQKFVAEHGEGLACIVLNGKNRFTIEQGGQKKEVHLAGPPFGEYTMEDLAAVIRQQWLEVHGQLPEGLEQKLAALAQAREPEPP